MLHTHRMRQDAGDRTERTTVTLPVGMAARLSYEARRSNRSASAVVRDALAAYFAGEPAPDPPSFVGIAASKPGAATSEQTEEEIRRIIRSKADDIVGRAPKRSKKRRP